MAKKKPKPPDAPESVSIKGIKVGKSLIPFEDAKRLLLTLDKYCSHHKDFIEYGKTFVAARVSLDDLEDCLNDTGRH